ncbi:MULTISPECIES: acyltransferase [unclassified Acidovorax]|uniref:acyltransferase family protein n=1 Tax=unclassified Acidovorax TaxID=2684926 RepID=UPI0028831C0D|nr:MULTISPECIES: acyltransferase [unclassified Acidovorax]
MSTANRNHQIDTIKGLACAAIVWHHLAFYGPMSDIAQPLAPGLMAGLSHYGRMAVQVFLVLGGYLAAASLAPAGMARFDAAGVQIGRRFVRLVVPYVVALVVAVLAAAVVRPWMGAHPSVPGEPSLPQLLAHAVLLHDVLGEEALSAGVWYVAIDFQLFASAVLLFAAARRFAGSPARAAWVARALVVGATAVSLWVFNRQAELDVWAVYFWGAYGLGMLACWGARSQRHGALWLAVIAVLGAVALWLDFRDRIALAWASAMGLAVLMRAPQPAAMAQWRLVRHAEAALQALGRMAYSVFLVHFPVCLVVNAVVSYAAPQSPVWNAAGMLLAFGLSVAAGRLLYLRVESRMPSWTLAVRWQAGFVGLGWAVIWAGGVLG